MNLRKGERIWYDGIGMCTVIKPHKNISVVWSDSKEEVRHIFFGMGLVTERQLRAYKAMLDLRTGSEMYDI